MTKRKKKPGPTVAQLRRLHALVRDVWRTLDPAGYRKAVRRGR